MSDETPHPPDEVQETIEQLQAALDDVPAEHIGYLACVAVYTDEAHEDQQGIALRLINPDTSGWEDTASILNSAEDFNDHLEAAKLERSGAGFLGGLLGG